MTIARARYHSGVIADDHLRLVGCSMGPGPVGFFASRSDLVRASYQRRITDSGYRSLFVTFVRYSLSTSTRSNSPDVRPLERRCPCRLQISVVDCISDGIVEADRQFFPDSHPVSRWRTCSALPEKKKPTKWVRNAFYSERGFWSAPHVDPTNALKGPRLKKK